MTAEIVTQTRRIVLEDNDAPLAVLVLRVHLVRQMVLCQTTWMYEARMEELWNEPPAARKGDT
jgi:hypothetical protein